MHECCIHRICNDSLAIENKLVVDRSDIEFVIHAYIFCNHIPNAADEITSTLEVVNTYGCLIRDNLFFDCLNDILVFIEARIAPLRVT